jgi:hypothetical protein
MPVICPAEICRTVTYLEQYLCICILWQVWSWCMSLNLYLKVDIKRSWSILFKSSDCHALSSGLEPSKENLVRKATSCFEVNMSIQLYFCRHLVLFTGGFEKKLVIKACMINTVLISSCEGCMQGSQSKFFEWKSARLLSQSSKTYPPVSDVSVLLNTSHVHLCLEWFMNSMFV